ncbi:hypothetical protein CON65_06710 [Bacillus pseudomycoides]|uniref:DUF975 domain-containing protein n=1 Tax=Bacillus pseudomycoides TaxID=64104 RepID=A0AA91VG69_9BACI|nr:MULTISPECIES: DUF975 family protein [Bacillus]PEB54060.1 hypothetical protein COO03_06700 [Bacillus sp. AFS098217]PED83555.1 hypothetical protein CON65_06710 [Bacillus pseudomycoides]PEU07632.1 hypothetical protein CN524_20130 [Bacillus sp. AFS019443]PEU09227.1 hypothetical protein CN525_24965 [Bacillus sp. AFS014408]PFW64048.1 hypothetical protein COL20_06180 [Bacillus sp. AFS075034]
MISDLKGRALDALEGKWGLAVGTTLLIAVFASVCKLVVTFPFSMIWGWNEARGSFSVDIVVMLIIGPLTLGAYYLVLNAIREREVRIGQLFRWFTDGTKFIKSFLTYLLVCIYLTLWTILLIIPGIIKSFSYAMTYFILNDHPEYSMNQAITESRRMMDGHKMDYFLLCLSFIGWFLLSIVTLGIGFLWLAPYFYTTTAAFYDEISQDYYQKENPTF